jgi:hypothetical protein
MPSLARRLNDAADLATAAECLEELIALQRIAAAETDAPLFRAQLDEIKGLLVLAEKRVVKLVCQELEQHICFRQRQ